MGNLYIFAIGGTGSRVLRSLTFLLASGVKTNVDKIIPIIIDTDVSNADTLRTTQLIIRYYNIKKELGKNQKTKAFNVDLIPITELKDTNNSSITDNDFVLKLPSSLKIDLKEYLNFHRIESEATKLLLESLYSEKNLNNELTHGFLGSPNVGSIVLEAITDSKEFEAFCNSFTNDDKIFIISSIFGGTGAAGFPLILNTFIQGVEDGASNAIKDCTKGAVTVLPYFKLEQDEKSQIDSNNFITKTIAALSYYENNLKGLNALYYIGDNESSKALKNFEGGQNQKNPANFVEVGAALSIVHFCNNNFDNNSCKYYEFAVETNERRLNFNNLGNNINEQIKIPLSVFKVFSWLHPHINTQVGSTFATYFGINNNFLTSKFYDNMSKFFNSFEDWLNELKDNDYSFDTFDSPKSETDYKNLLNYKKSDKITKENIINACADKNKRKLKTDNKKSSYLNLLYNSIEEVLIKNNI